MTNPQAMGNPARRSERATLDSVTAWLEQHVRPLEDELVPLARAVGRIAAGDVVASAAVPPVDRAAADGVALRAAETVGASAYNPLAFRLAALGAGWNASLPPAGAAAVAAGDPLPGGADAVIAIDQVQRDGTDGCEIIEPAGAGSNVVRAGAHIAAGSCLIRAGQRLDGYAIGGLAAAGLDALAVVRQPRVRLVLTGRGLLEPGAPPTAAATYDADRPLLEALVARDGGHVDAIERVGHDRAALAVSLVASGADIVLVVGGTGPGADDAAAAALADSGTLAIHGVAVRQCETAGVGSVPPGVPVILLPGTPAACLWAYELFGGQAVRRRAGRPAALPFGTRHVVLDRKIASAIGMVDICPVVCRADGHAEPIASFIEAGLAAALRADGVVMVPEGSEGYARGSTVMMYQFRD